MVILIVLLNFISYKIGPILVSDIAYFFLLMFTLIKRVRIKIAKQNKYMYIFIFTSFLVMILNVGKTYFSINDFFLTYIKFIFYIIGLLLIPNLFIENENKLNKGILYSIRIVCFLGVYQYLAHFLPFNIPYSLSINSYGYESMTSYNIFRIRSIYSEPSLFLYTVILFFYLKTSKVNIKKWDYMLFIVSIILTFSITVYGLVIFGVLVNLTNSNISILKKIIIVVLLILLCLLSFYKLDIIKQHIFNLIMLKPSSATTRLFGSIIYAFFTPNNGVGFGNVENYYLLNNLAETIPMFITNGIVNNIFAAIKIMTGYIGLGIFLVYLLKNFFCRSKKLLLIVIASCFTWGNFNSSGFLFFLILLETQNKLFRHDLNKLKE